VTEKAHEVANDPNVKKGVQKAGSMGMDVVKGVKQDGQETAAAAQRGDYATVAKHVAPMVLGGGVGGVIVKEVAPKVIAEGVKQLPPGTRHQIESSGAGKMALGAVEHGHIPTSPADLARMAAENARKGAVDAAVKSVTDGKVHTSVPPARVPVPSDSHAVTPNVVNKANQVFPSWMKPAPRDAPKH
jgi:hypothetical protein